MISAKDRIRIYIKGRPVGWVFSWRDIALDLPRFAIDQSLVALNAEGVIQRALRGIYYKGVYNQILRRCAPPDVRQVAEAIARKFRWTLAPADDRALNRVGLSTQVTSRYVFQTSGPSREYKVGQHSLVLRHRCLRETEFRSPETANVVRALKALGREHASQDVVWAIRKQYSAAQWKGVCRECRHASEWIRAAVCSLEED